MNIFNFGHRVEVCIGVSGGGGWGGGEMESSWEVLVLPVIFVTLGKRAILFPFVNTILRIHCQKYNSHFYVKHKSMKCQLY